MHGTEAEVLQYEAEHPIGSQARLSFALAIYTSRRSADLIRMGRQHVRDGRISVRQQKTGTLLAIRLDPKLKEILDLAPSEHLTFLVSQLGKPYKSAGSFGQRMKLWAREADLAGCPLHGLRKVCLPQAGRGRMHRAGDHGDQRPQVTGRGRALHQIGKAESYG